MPRSMTVPYWTLLDHSRTERRRVLFFLRVELDEGEPQTHSSPGFDPVMVIAEAQCREIHRYSQPRRGLPEEHKGELEDPGVANEYERWFDLRLRLEDDFRSEVEEEVSRIVASRAG